MKSNSDPVKAFRARQSMRVDYYPSEDVAQILRSHLESKTGAKVSIAGVVDNLIRAGHQAIAGNDSATNTPIAGNPPTAVPYPQL